MTEPLARLAGVLRAEGGLLAAALLPDAPHATPYGDLASRGPRARGREAELELVVEAVREGYLLHYDVPRLLDPGEADFALLAGDRLYALGLAQLAELGDLDSVVELADVIALSAVAHAAGDRELADAVWLAGAAAVGWGATRAHAEAKATVRSLEPGAASALRAAARQLAKDLAP